MNVRFEGNNGHDADMTRCLLMTQGGHPVVEAHGSEICSQGTEDELISLALDGSGDVASQKWVTGH